MATFYTNFERAVKSEVGKTRAELQKMDSAIAGVFNIQGQSVGSMHEKYIGPVQFLDSSPLDVNGDTPNPQHPSIRTRKNNYRTAELNVGIPRGVAQTMGMSVSQLAAEYMTQARAAYMRKLEEQIGELMIDTYRDNPVMDGRDATEDGGDFDVRVFPTAQNFAAKRGSSLGKWDFLDLMEARVTLANTMRTPVTREIGSVKEVNATVRNAKYVVWCDNDTWFSFIRENEDKYFNVDYAQSKTAFQGDGLKVAAVQDMAIVTTTQRLPITGRPDRFNAQGRPVSSGGTQTSDNWRPVMIFPVGAFSLAKPTVDMFNLQVKEYQTKRFEQIIYGQCNLYAHRVYDNLFLRYWVDVS